LSAPEDKTGLLNGLRTLINAPSWPETRQKALGFIATVLCLTTFMFVATTSIDAPQVGAINVLIWALLRSVPITFLVAIATLVFLIVRNQRR